jgi:transcriptional regulator with XRE-family HTH domain
MVNTILVYGVKRVNRLREIRLRRGLSQGALARIINRDRTQISALECGEHTPRIETLRLLARALECSVVDLLPDHDKVAGIAAISSMKAIE